MLSLLRGYARRPRNFLLTTGGALLVAAAPMALAQEFKLAMSSPPTSLDPHFYNLFSNLNVSDHMFETLVTMDADSRLIPGLAESWTRANNLTWEFKRRTGSE